MQVIIRRLTLAILYIFTAAESLGLVDENATALWDLQAAEATRTGAFTFAL